MKVHGEENFRLLILKYFRTSEEAYAYEGTLITQEIIRAKYCYNQQGGGKGFASGSLHFMHEKTKLGKNPWAKRPDGSSSGGDTTKLKIELGLYKSPWSMRPDGTSSASDKVKNGTFHSLRRPDGTSIGQEVTAAGKNPWSHEKPWDKNFHTQGSILAWFFAYKIYLVHINFPEYKTYKLRTVCNKLFKIKEIHETLFPVESIKCMLLKFKSGWNPKKDISWKLFRTRYLENGGEHYVKN
jgi:hypothetical protein